MKVVRRIWIALFLLSLGSAAGCGKLNTLNSVAGDAGRYSLDGSAEFLAVRQIFAAKCATCHVSFSTYSEQEWMDNGYVVAASPSGSMLFQRLKSNGISGSQQDMPPTDVITSTEANAVRDWINSL